MRSAVANFATQLATAFVFVDFGFCLQLLGRNVSYSVGRTGIECLESWSSIDMKTR
jgi:hypothetical protein